ncbi:SAM-dependent methyltransferase [Rhizobium sp. CRRU65]|uniref:SAM-dependent methyltransferase n=1 Tax=Rhizobium sp. CRRU65 TaxID=3399566 RepID=UPI003AF4EA1D
MIQHYLATSLRRALEKTIKEARVVAESGASDAIRRLGIAEAKAPTYLSEEEKELRRRLRAHARTLGDKLHNDSDEQEVKRLIEAAAYAHWHRMLFARFLAERGLLRHPEHNVPVTLEDCREIAQEECAADAWVVAERYAASMLPAVFRIDDPVLSLKVDAAQNQALHRLVTDLDDDIFQAEDSLGWTYQFWRAAEKDAVNKKGDKIGADEISAVTQLFTEPYMVRFLLHNTLGAWWAGKILAANPELAKSAADEDALRAACSLPGYAFDVLRFVKQGVGEEALWQPAAGTFPGWPIEASEITMLDPCCGSGHFLTESLTILSALRQAEEGLTSADAVAAALRDNLHGLEIDGRCVQIAAFAVALTAWRIGGWQTLPLPHIAWVGAPPPLPKLEFASLANGDTELRKGLEMLFDIFSQASLLGSLIDPRGGDLMSPQRLGKVGSLLDELVQRTRSAEPEHSEGVVAARGMADGAAMLSRHYTLVATNVPFLGRGKQDERLAKFVERHFANAKADLASTMISRISRLLSPSGTLSCVSPQHCFFQGSYREYRRELLDNLGIDFFVPLGEEAWEQFGDRGPQTVLMAFSNIQDPLSATHAILDVSEIKDRNNKKKGLRENNVAIWSQTAQRQNVDQVISSHPRPRAKLLSEVAQSVEGMSTGDSGRYLFMFWEQADLGQKFEYFIGSPNEGRPFSGRNQIVRWEKGRGALARESGARIQGHGAWGKRGLIVSGMRDLNWNFYFGERHDKATAVLIVDEDNLSAVAAYLGSGEYLKEVRKIDRAVHVTTGTLVKVPYDRAHWAQVATELYPDGLPEPFTGDPIQWLFHGHPAKTDSGAVLHVALARLCGHRWPAETEQAIRLSAEAREWVQKAGILPEGDGDGLLSVAGVAGEKPLADRLRTFLSTAFGAEWSDALERRLVAESDEVLDKKQGKDGSLEAWLRDRAFRQHCALFQQRPFLWHIWDGLKDGFSVFVHYHRFTQANLRKLTYTMLGDSLRRAKDEDNDLRYEKGRELQQKLELVLEGEAPYDIFVRWKPLAEQPFGWDPDLDDGVRMNIRPFMEAGILREQPKGIKWTKDRGNDVPSAPWYPVFKGERINDHHTTIEEKRAARAGNPETVAKK